MDLDDNYKEVESSSNNNNVFNKFCIDSLSNDRTFCVNNNNEIVVYKSNTHDDVLEKLSSLPVIQEYKGKIFVTTCFNCVTNCKVSNNFTISSISIS